MKTNFLINLLLLLGIAGINDAISQRLEPGGSHAVNKEKPQPDLDKYNQAMQSRGLRFTENKGQVTDLDGKPRPDVLFTAQNDGVKLFLTAQGIYYQFKREFVKQQVADGKMQLPAGKTMQEIEKTEFYRLDLKLKGANPRPVVQTEGAGQDVENFFLAHGPQGIEGVRNFAKITYKEVYPYIDWVVYTKNGGLEYDFVVRPGGKVSDIQLSYDGEQTLALQKNGALKVTTPLGSITENKPFCFQEEGKEVVSRFVVSGDGFGFDVPAYDKNETLTIDPVVEWATYYGGSSNEWGTSVATDATGNVFLAGYTGSDDNISSGGFQNTRGGSFDAFLVKFNSEGIRQWATYYGGSSNDFGHSVATDASGNVFLAGETQSTSGIASGGHKNSVTGGGGEAFLVKFNSNGGREWATYYGGNDVDRGYAVATDASGNVFLSGITFSTENIASDGFQNTKGGGNDAFLVKFNAAGVRLWGTYYGGVGNEQEGSSLAVDGSGNVFIAVKSTSSAGLSLNGHYNIASFPNPAEILGNNLTLLVKFTSSGNRAWATYYNGFISSVATDASGNIFVAGTTNQLDGIASGGHKNFLGFGQDAFLVKFNGTGVRQWGTYYGADFGIDFGTSVCTDASGNVFLGGYTTSETDIALRGAQNTNNGIEDAYLVKFNTSGQRQWGTYYGGLTTDLCYGIAVSASDVYLVGHTFSIAGIATGGHQNTNGGFFDAYLVKFKDEPLPIFESFSPEFGPYGTSVTLTGHSFTGVTSVSFNNVNASFEIISSTEIRAVVPDGATTGKIKITKAASNVESVKDFYVGYKWYRDKDRDGFGADGYTLIAMNQPSLRHVLVGGDCRDGDNTVYPGAPELGDGLDNDCDGEVDEGLDCRITWYRDVDGDGFGQYNSYRYSCTQPNGYVSNRGDCNDNDPSRYSGASELADGKDNDCDGEVDEGLACRITWYIDFDGDGYGSASRTKLSCVKPFKYVDRAGDCNDNDYTRYPGAPELCDGKDNDCDGVKDEGCSPIMFSQNQPTAPNMLAAQKVAPEKISANAFPNPHNGSFVLEVQSPVAGKSAIVLYDLQGRAMVQRNEQLQVGTNRVRFDALQKMTFMYKVTIGAHSVAGKVLGVR